MDDNSAPFKFGQSLAIAMLGESPVDCQKVAAVIEYFDKPGSDYGRFQKLTCKLAANVYRAAGREDAFGCHLLDKIATTRWNEEYTPYYEAALFAFGEEAKASNALASGAAGLLKNIGLGAVANTPNTLMTIAALSALGGGSVGSLAWLANRGATKDDADTETTRQRAIQYENLAARIDQELRNRSPRQEQAELV
jgi:hypothetical protein